MLLDRKFSLVNSCFRRLVQRPSTQKAKDVLSVRMYVRLTTANSFSARPLAQVQELTEKIGATKKCFRKRTHIKALFSDASLHGYARVVGRYDGRKQPCVLPSAQSMELGGMFLITSTLSNSTGWNPTVCCLTHAIVPFSPDFRSTSGEGEM